VNRRLATFIIFAALAGPHSARAQQPQPLTLAQALDRAEKQNLDLQAARAQRAVAAAGIRVAGQHPNPTAFVSVLRDTPHESLFFDQPLEVGGRRGKRIELAKEEAALTEADITSAARQLRRSVRAAYFNLAFARRVTAEKSGSAKLASRLREIAQARFDSGDIPQLEVTQAELELARANADSQVAHRQEDIAQSQLNVLLNAPPATAWELLTGLDDVPQQLSLEQLAEKAARSNSEIARLLGEQKVEMSRTGLFKAERIPNLGLEFGADFNSPGPGGFKAGGRGQLSVELPLWNRNQGEIAQSSATLRALEQETQAKRRAIAGQIESAYYELNARQAEVALYSQTLVPSTRQLESLAEESYKSGKANILTVLGVQRDVTLVESEYLNSLLAMQTSLAELEEIVGSPLD